MTDLTEILLALGDAALAAGRRRTAISLYKRALRHAEVTVGYDSPEVGLVLLRMIDFYESENDDEKADTLQKRVRRIILNHVLELHKANQNSQTTSDR